MARPHVQYSLRTSTKKKYRESVQIVLNEIDLALKEASAPMKEFQGVDKEKWGHLSEWIEEKLGSCKESRACRQIAESLE